MPSHRSEIIPAQRPIRKAEIHLIDRSDELSLLKQAVDQAVHGEGSTIFLHGEAGIGKTRLARELGAYARLREMQVLSGRCPALFKKDGVPPYVLWREVIKDYLESCSPEQIFRVVGFYPVEICKLVPELRQKLRSIPESFPLSPEHSRDRLFEAVSQLVINISKEAPLLVTLDDLQWTDQSSLLLLHYLARGVQRESLLLLGAYRDTYIDKNHPLSPVLAELNRERQLQSVSLRRLGFKDVSEMIRLLLNQNELPEEFLKLVYEKTRGNPFFVEEVVKSLQEDDTILRDGKKWKIKKVSNIEFPETVKDVVRARLNRLSEGSHNVLTLASFIGNEFTFDALNRTSDVGEDKLLEIMEQMLRAGLIKQRVIRGEDICSFADVIVRDVVYEEVSPLRRKKIHKKIGAVLEEVYAENLDERHGELALHFLEGGDKAKALDHFLKAGEKSFKIYANAEATSYFQSALMLLEERKDKMQERGTVLEQLGDIKHIVGEKDASIEHWAKALDNWRQLGESKKVAGIHMKMANAFWEDIGDPQKADAHHDEAYAILKTLPENVELARLYEDISHKYYRAGELSKASRNAEKALKLSMKLDDFQVLSLSYASLGTIFSFIGEKRRASECLEKALKVALDNGYVETALRAYNNLAAVLPVEENEKVFEYLKKGYELARKVGHVTMQSWIGNGLGYALLGMGNTSEALSLVQESIALDKRSGNIPNLTFSLLAFGYYYIVIGDWEKSSQYLEEALVLAKELKHFQMLGGAFTSFGWLSFEKGNYVKAKEYLEKATRVFDKAKARDTKMENLLILIAALIELNDLEQAEKLINTLEAYSLETKNSGLLFSSYTLKAVLLRSRKEWKASLSLFEKNLQKAETLNLRRWSLYNFARFFLFEYGRTYLDRNQEGDREKAYKLLSEALEILQKIGAKKTIEKIEAILTPRPEKLEKIKPVEAGKKGLSTHINTGHKDLDNLLIKGILRKNAVILTSPSCEERDFLIKRFLEAGAEENQTTFYISTNINLMATLKKELQPKIHLFLCNPQADMMVKDPFNHTKLKGIENLTEISITLSSASRRLKAPPTAPRRVCIEIISDVLLRHHADKTRRWLTALIPELKSKEFTTLAIINPQMHPQEEVHAILGLFDGEISINKNRDKPSEKVLKVERISGQKYLKDEMPIKTTNEENHKK